MIGRNVVLQHQTRTRRVCNIMMHLGSVATGIAFFPNFLRPENKVYVTLPDSPRFLREIIHYHNMKPETTSNLEMKPI